MRIAAHQPWTWTDNYGDLWFPHYTENDGPGYRPVWGVVGVSDEWEDTIEPWMISGWPLITISYAISDAGSAHLPLNWLLT